MAKKRDHEGMRRRLIKAATVVFGRQSHLEASMTEIAAEAGVAKGTIYLYFKNKDELIVELFRHCVDECRLERRDELQLDPTAGAAQQLRAAVRFFLNSAIEYRAIWALWFHFMALSASARFRSTILRVCQDDCQNLAGIFGDILRHGVATGEFRPDLDVPATAHLGYALTTGYTQLIFIEGAGDIQALGQSAIDQLIQGIRNPASSA